MTTDQPNTVSKRILDHAGHIGDMLMTIALFMEEYHGELLWNLFGPSGSNVTIPNGSADAAKIRIAAIAGMQARLVYCSASSDSCDDIRDIFKTPLGVACGKLYPQSTDNTVAEVLREMADVCSSEHDLNLLKACLERTREHITQEDVVAAGRACVEQTDPQFLHTRFELYKRYGIVDSSSRDMGRLTIYGHWFISELFEILESVVTRTSYTKTELDLLTILSRSVTSVPDIVLRGLDTRAGAIVILMQERFVTIIDAPQAHYHRLIITPARRQEVQELLAAHGIDGSSVEPATPDEVVELCTELSAFVDETIQDPLDRLMHVLCALHESPAGTLSRDALEERLIVTTSEESAALTVTLMGAEEKGLVHQLPDSNSIVLTLTGSVRATIPRTNQLTVIKKYCELSSQRMMQPLFLFLTSVFRANHDCFTHDTLSSFCDMFGIGDEQRDRLIESMASHGIISTVEDTSTGLHMFTQAGQHHMRSVINLITMLHLTCNPNREEEVVDE